MQEDITWDLIEFWETWDDVGYHETTGEISRKEKLLYDKAQSKLLAKHEKIRATVEAEAVKIGL
jgi:hypothetical protein